MDDETNPEIFANNKWILLKDIAHIPQSPTDLAAKTGTSLSNITQQLKLLEAHKIVRKERSEEKSTGKPRTIYHINNELVYAMLLMNGKAERRTFKVDNINRMLFNIIFSMSPEDILIMLKFCFKYEDVLKKCKAIGFIKSTRDNIELFLITDHLDEIRSKFSNIFIEDYYGKTKKIINWSHNEFEVNDGLEKKDKYFMDMIKNVQAIHDPGNILIGFRETRDKI
jgi:DNA-binding transcriptional ArsR family regulator